MQISKINYLNSNVKINNFKGQDCSKTDSKAYQIGGLNGDKIDVLDKNGLLSIENISDKKVGSKFLIKFNDPKYNGFTVLFKPDSAIKSKDGSVNVEMIQGMTTFTGRLYGSIRQNADGSKDENMENAYNNFWTKGMHNAIIQNYVDKNATSQIKDDYNFYIPSDGDGTRYRDIALLQGGVTKPASFIPAKLNGENMNLIHAIIANFAKTDKLDKGVDFIHVEPARGSAFAFLEGLKSGKIPTDKPIVFSWGDNFSDLNYPKIIKEHEKLNSGFSVHTLLTDDERIKAFAGVELNNLEDKSITYLKEKPTDPAEIERFKLKEYDNQCLGAIGPYVLSTPALKWIKEEYTKNPQSFLNPTKGFDFSSMIIARMQTEFEKGNIKDENGTPLRMKAIIMDENDTWSDLGAQKDFTEAMENIKAGQYKNLPQEIRTTISNNLDNKGNLTFDEKAREMLEQIEKDYGLEFKNTISYFKD